MIEIKEFIVQQDSSIQHPAYKSLPSLRITACVSWLIWA